VALVLSQASGVRAAPSGGVAPVALVERLGKARYQIALTTLPDTRVVYAFDGLPAGTLSALSWVRSEQMAGRVVLCNQGALDELTSGSTPLFSCTPERAKAWMKEATLVEVPRA
jgi:hypothetical protein